MRALTYVEPGTVAWQDADDPVPGDPHAAVVTPVAVARCDLDPIMAAFGMFPGSYPVGHETVARIRSIGDEVSHHAVGDLVLVPFQVSCGACPVCRSGRYGACDTYRARAGAAFGFGEAGGGHGGAVADLLLVPHADHLLVPAPADVPVEALATLPDNVVDGYRAVAPQLAAMPGADVLVMGGAAASIGLYATAWAVALGARAVRYADSDADRCAAAQRLGADVEEVGESWPRRFDRALITVEGTAQPDGLRAAIASTDAYGWCTSIALHLQPVELPLLAAYTRGLTFHTSRADSRRYLPEVLDHVCAARFDPLAIPTQIVPWDEAEEAWLRPANQDGDRPVGARTLVEVGRSLHVRRRRATAGRQQSWHRAPPPTDHR